MLKPAMNKHFFAIFLLLFSLLVSSQAEARLTLGFVPGTEPSSGEISSAQALSLAELLTERLQEEVVVKELEDSATLINWIDRFAMLDLALLSSKEVKANPGRFLSLGKIDEQGELVLVSRQGISGAWPQRAAEVLREPAGSNAETKPRPALQAPPLVEESVPDDEQAPLPVEEVVDVQKELEQVPPLRPGRAWAPKEEGAYHDFLPSEEATLKKLVLGVIPDPKGLLRTTEQARQLALYLEQTLPVSVTIREFARMEAFAEWFMRYRMVDLAILAPTLAEANLGRDYQALVKLLRSDKPGEESSELVIVRRGQNQELLGPLQHAFLDMSDVSAGQDLMKVLRVSQVLGLDEAVRGPAVVEEIPEPIQAVPPVPVELPEEVVEAAVEELQPPTPEYAEPDEPLPPPTVVVKPIPDVPKPGMPIMAPPVPVIVDIVPERPEPKMKVSEPVEPPVVADIKLPELAPLVPEPLEPPGPTLPPVVEATAPPEIVAVVEPPVVPQVPVSTKAPTPEEAPLLPQEELTLIPVAPVAPAVAEPPTAELENIVPTQVLEESLSASLEPVEVVTEPVELAESSDQPATPVEEAIKEPAAPLTPDPSKGTLSEETVVLETETPVVSSTLPNTLTVEEQRMIEEAKLFADLVPANDVAVEEQRMIEEAKLFADIVPAHDVDEPKGANPEVSSEDLLNAEILALLGQDSVAAMVAQPEIPQEFRPSGVPVVRTPRKPSLPSVAQDELLVASIPEPRKQTIPAQPPQLLPQPEPEPGVVYVVPFVAIMVPNEVHDRIFDQFVDLLNQGGEELGLQFVILKEGLQRVEPTWLDIRKYVTGEIYAYVEDSGCCSTDLRTKARLTYHRPGQGAPAFGYEYPVKNFFEHDRSSIDIERVKLADNIAATLARELLTALRN